LRREICKATEFCEKNFDRGVNVAVMVDPSIAPGEHHLFICGNDAAANAKVAQFIADNFGWKRENIIDLGDISNSRGTEMYLALWIRFWGKLGTPHFNVQVVRASKT